MNKELGVTEAILQEMLRENTGRGICDSGGDPRFDETGKYIGSSSGYGRNYERNQKVDFETVPAAILSFKYGSVELTYGVYHWLRDRLWYNEGMQADFDTFCGLAENEEKGWLCLMQDFPDWLRATRKVDVTGLYGDGTPFTMNTYNGESLLSQVLQFLYLEVDGDPYVLLQIHGGCDVRGGYTAPRAFKLSGDGGCMLSSSDGYICCVGRRTDAEGQLCLDGKEVDPPRRHSWDTDDAYHWRPTSEEDLPLKNYYRKEIEDISEWEEGLLCILPDGSGCCPVCGARLEPVGSCIF